MARQVEDHNSTCFGYVALTATPDKKLQAQGAMVCDLAASSLREPGRPALYLQNVASRPLNRVRLVENRAIYRGVGEGLVRLAMLESYRVGYQGRVLLQPLPESEKFYEDRKFALCLDPVRGRRYYEIGGGNAQSLLKKEGWI